MRESKIVRSVSIFALIAILLVNATVIILPANADLGPDFNLKWSSGYLAGGGEAVLAADVIGDDNIYEVFYAGNNWVYCLDGNDGSIIWDTQVNGVGDTCQPQMADLDNDGSLEIVVALKSPAGLRILDAEDGDLWPTTGLGPNSAWGRTDSSPVIGDVNGDGYPTIFFPTMAFTSDTPTTGRLFAFEYDEAAEGIVQRMWRYVWHPCAGGLSLADTDNDGVFELYMADRDTGYNDGSWGRGCISFWAENLTERWSVYDWLMSSNIPMLADVNKDGILDVVAANLRGGLAVYNSTDGRPLGDRRGDNERINTHYQSSVYDIDGDGNLEMLSADGYYARYGKDVDIFDLVDWYDEGANLIAWDEDDNHGIFFGPQIGEVTGDGVMDIVAVEYRGLYIFNGTNYALMDSYTGLTYRCVSSCIQDIDDDGLNEILVQSQGGRVYCFNTPGIAASPRARSWVQFYSESRNGVSEYVPFDRSWPDVTSTDPYYKEVDVPTSITQLSFSLSHPEGSTMDWSVTTNPDIGGGTGSGGDGTYNVAVSGLSASTTYTWQLNVTDENDHHTNKTLVFTTAPYDYNDAPTHTTPLLTSASGSGTEKDDLTCTPQDTYDDDGDDVTNIFNWYRNGVSFTNLLLPFDTMTDPDLESGGCAVTYDYSGYENHENIFVGGRSLTVGGNVFGATWIPDGVVGGAYEFGADGRSNDFIRIEEKDDSLGGDGTWDEISIEFCVKATSGTSSRSRALFQKSGRNQTNMNGYRIDFSAGDTSNQITWRIYTATEQFSVTGYVTDGLLDWHHVVCTYKSGEGLTIYVDGEEEAILPGVSGNINGTNIGGSAGDAGPLDIAFGGFVGCLDEVRVYERAISPFQVSMRYDETVGGSSGQSMLAWQETLDGETWRCEVTPNDGKEDGTPLLSNSITIIATSNDPPEASNLAINPSSPVYSDDLEATYDFYDPDGDEEFGSEIRWYKDSALQSDLNDNPIVDRSLTSAGEEWYFTVRPGDSIELGELETSPTVTIGRPVFSVETLTAWHWSNTTILSTVEADVDDDGDVEIITGGYYDDGDRDVAQLVVWDGATLTVEGLTTWYWTDDTRINSVAVGDVDDDGADEIVTGGYYNDKTRDIAQLVVWNGTTLAVEGLTSWYWTDDTRINSVAVADVDGYREGYQWIDSEPEIVTGGYYNDGERDVAQLVVWNGTTLAVDSLTSWYWTDDTRINSVAVADVDSYGEGWETFDDAAEIVTGGYYNDGERDVAQLVVWNGTTLEVEDLTSWYWTGDTQINSVAVEDVDDDDSVEIATAGYYTDGVRAAQLVYWNGSNLAFENVVGWYWTSDTQINSVGFGDVDDDYKDEVVTAGYYNDGERDVAQLVAWDKATLEVKSVTTWYWTGDTRINSLAIGDVDSDGIQEMITGGSYNDGADLWAQLVVWTLTSP